MKKLITNPKIHIAFLMLLLFICFLFWQPQQGDDGINYQRFSQLIVEEGRIDLSIPGFHGSDWLVAVVYMITGSQYATYLVDMLAAILVVIMIYLLVKELFHKEILAVMASYLYVLMPFEYFNAVRGGHQPLFLLLAMLAVYLLLKNKWYNWLVLSITHITYPFSITLLPFYIYKKKFTQFLLSLIIPAGYVLAQYLQIGRIIVGQHTYLNVENVFSLKRFVINIVYGIQWYFSIHNFSPVSQSYISDLIHLSPLITVMAVLGILYYKKYFAEKRMFITLFAFAVLSYLLTCSLYRFETFYMGLFNLALIFLALPVMIKYKKMIPIIVGTYCFQFFYHTLYAAHYFTFSPIIFIIPASVLIISLIYVWHEWKLRRLNNT